LKFGTITVPIDEETHIYYDDLITTMYESEVPLNVLDTNSFDLEETYEGKNVNYKFPIIKELYRVEDCNRCKQVDTLC
jgi:hypothetical protein